MKKIIYLLLALIAFEAKAQAQTVFKMKYLPGHKYTSTSAIGLDVKVNMTGDDQMIDKLKSQGITLPVALKLGIDLSGDISAGTLTNNSFPLNVSFLVQDVKVNLNGNDIDPLKGKSFAIKIYAHSNTDGKIKADSSLFNNKKDTAQAAMSSILNGLQNQINFPDRALKVGDSFTLDNPLNLPLSKMGGTASKSSIKTVYTLVNIADGKAYFDVAQTADVEVSVKTVTAALTGNGAGKLVYDIKDSCPLSFNDKMSLKLNVTIGKLVVEGTADLSLNNNYTIN